MLGLIKFSNWVLTPGMAWKFYTIVAEGLKPKFRKFLWLITTFVEVSEKKLVGVFLPPASWKG